MRKLRLELEALSVESFEVFPPEGRRGTVRGAEISLGFTCDTDEFESCAGSCDGCGSGAYTCGASCGGCATDDPTCYRSCEAVDTCFPVTC